MEKRIFLTGAEAETRSRLIREALGERLAEAGGFVLRTEPGPDGFAEGYALCPAAAAGGVEGLESRRFLDCRVWPPAHDNEVFRDFGVRLLEEASFYPFALLDEIGGYETLIPQFAAALSALLQSALPIVGALKTTEEAERWRQLFGLGKRFTGRIGQLHAALESDPDTRVADLGEISEDEVLLLLRAWAKEHL